MWEMFFAISFLANVFLILYARWLIKLYSNLTKETHAINETVLKFTEHVKSVHDLEMFYGDETLSALMQHGKELVDKIQDLDLITEDEETDKEETQEN